MKAKKKYRIMVGTEVLLLCMIVGILKINATSSNPSSNGVNYNKNNQVTVQNALDDLYNKANYGNATTTDILSGKKALVGGKEIVGTYTCPTLASQTPGDAMPDYIDSGKIAWVNGNRIVGTGSLLKDKVKIGDYISYTPSTNSYTITRVDSEWSLFDDLTIYPSKLRLWRVIRKNEDGTVDIVSHFISTEHADFSFSGLNYQNYLKVLNKAAEQYETDGFTVGSRHMGYNRTELDECMFGFSESDEWKESDIGLVSNVYGSLCADYSIENTAISRYYWLAFRNQCRSGYLQFSPTDNCAGYSTFFYTDEDSSPLRPIVVLKSDLKVTGGDGTENNPYTLGL